MREDGERETKGRGDKLAERQRGWMTHGREMHTRVNNRIVKLDSSGNSGLDRGTNSVGWGGLMYYVYLPTKYTVLKPFPYKHVYILVYRASTCV